ncbi:MAG: adenine deaminase [Bacteroidales bacterium]|nr:adenine deaminase [Bacteroidales bacterium]
MKDSGEFNVSGKVVDLVSGKIIPGIVTVKDGRIASIQPSQNVDKQYIVPGLIDAHVHIESSMLIPSEFARLASVHGTVATVSDPHEIANVLGIDGIHYMINNGKKVPFKFYFGASSCVPATGFESSGANIGVEQIDELMSSSEIKYMSEMMNFPGVLFHDEQVMQKIAVAKKYNKPIDGHAPGLKGDDARKYIEAGITTDHECFTMEEALDKIKYGMKIQIREGSAAKNFDALIGLLHTHPDMVLFCSDDKHPNDLVKGHINQLVKRAIGLGYDPLLVLKSCIINPIKHYKLDVGILQPGDDADFILVDNLDDFNITETYVNGILIAKNGKTCIDSVNESEPNIFKAEKITPDEIAIPATSSGIKVIKAFDGQLITGKMIAEAKVEKGNVVSDTDRDILKMIVMNRYKKAAPAKAFIHNFGIKHGAIASTVAHDSHNIIALGATDEDIVKAVNLLVDTRGGISVIDGEEEHVLPLPVAGLMSADDGYKTAAAYEKMDTLAKKLGSQLKAPFMTLSFMALLVIPDLKLSDEGLFDGTKFAFTELMMD